MSLAAVVFDFDGVVFDSETPEYESHRRLYEECGIALTVEEWCDAIGVWSAEHDDRRFDALCARAAAAPTRADYHMRRHALFEDLAPRAPMRGIVGLLDELDRAEVPAAIASTAPSRWLDSMPWSCPGRSVRLQPDVDSASSGGIVVANGGR